MEWKKKDGATSIKEVFMRNVGIKNISDANGWFEKSYENGYLISGLKEACAMLNKFKNSTVTIVGDYDADGVTSTAILYLGLKECGFKDVNWRIPRRFSEGFGINESIIDEINNGLIITCDNGITGISAIKKAKEKGLSVIVTDHHQPLVEDGRAVLPDADIIIDPNAIEGSADFSGYCGAGLALKLIRQMLDDSKGYKKYLPLAAIGTVADVMELKEENYVIVRNGLGIMSTSIINGTGLRSGLQALLKAWRCTSGISSGDLAFKVAPSLNAFSRMSDTGAGSAVELLCFNGSKEEAEKMAEKAIINNSERKRLEKQGTQKAVHEILETGVSENCPIVAYVEGLHEGVVGIIAASVAEKFRKPALIFTDMPQDQHLVKGSARGYGNYNVKAEFDKCPELFVQYGGHAGAAGMTVLKDNLGELSDELNANSQDFDPLDEDDVCFYDLEVNEKDLEQAISEKERYAPYGEGNPEPIFKVTSFAPVSKQGTCKKLMGDGNMVKISGLRCEAVNFSFGEGNCIYGEILPGKKFDMVGTIGMNRFNGAETPQVVFSDIRLVS